MENLEIMIPGGGWLELQGHQNILRVIVYDFTRQPYIRQIG